MQRSFGGQDINTAALLDWLQHTHTQIQRHRRDKLQPLCLRRYSSGVSKKRVVFADTKGLALTAVRFFDSELSPPKSPLLARAKPQLCISSRLQHHKLQLGFPQPKLDLKDLLTRPRDTHVQLESCSVSENSFSGKVYASHCGTEGAVHVRVTFDTWRSHHDVPCKFLQQQRCGTSDMDVFTFDINLPQNVDPKERTEFCVSFRPSVGSVLYWDDNRGQNYRLYIESDASHTAQAHPDCDSDVLFHK
uniref:CBM21 domain-containing protein n=1 Tax=Salarias fasciatus TaxID=181472 RepID=A0A672J5P5_SALFA